MQPLQRMKIAESCPSLRALSHLASLLLQTSGSLPEVPKQRGLDYSGKRSLQPGQLEMVKLLEDMTS